MRLARIETIDVEQMGFRDIMMLLKARKNMSGKLTFATKDSGAYQAAIGRGRAPRSGRSGRSGAFCIAVRVLPGPLGARFEANYDGCGATVREMVNVQGGEGQLSRQGIRAGMWLVSVDGRDCEPLSFSEIEDVLYGQRGRPRVATDGVCDQRSRRGPRRGRANPHGASP